MDGEIDKRMFLRQNVIGISVVFYSTERSDNAQQQQKMNGGMQQPNRRKTNKKEVADISVDTKNGKVIIITKNETCDTSINNNIFIVRYKTRRI